MKVKSISGLVCYVKDIDKTADFYQKLRFREGKRNADFLSMYVNWFWVEFCRVEAESKSGFIKEASLESKGAGVFLCLSVDNVDDTYKEVVAAGLKPSSEPKDWPYGRREFVLRDPDGYKLVFFTKK